MYTAYASAIPLGHARHVLLFLSHGDGKVLL